MGTRMAPSYAKIFMASRKQNAASSTTQPLTIYMVTLHRRHLHALDTRASLPHNLPLIHEYIPSHNQIQSPTITHIHPLFRHHNPSHHTAYTTIHTLHQTHRQKPTTPSILSTPHIL